MPLRSDVLPCPAISRVLNRHQRHAKLLREHLRKSVQSALRCRKRFSYFSNIILCKFSRASSLYHHVSKIFKLTSCKQVKRVYTGRIVTGMTNKHQFRNFLDKQSVRNTMSHLACSWFTSSHHSVSKPNSIPYPNPAISLFVIFHLLYKSVEQRLLGVMRITVPHPSLGVQFTEPVSRMTTTTSFNCTRFVFVVMTHVTKIPLPSFLSIWR